MSEDAARRWHAAAPAPPDPSAEDATSEAAGEVPIAETAMSPPPGGGGWRARRAAKKAGRVSRYPVLILMLIQADDQMDRFLLAALFPAIKEDFLLSDLQLGLLSSAFVIVGTLGAVPFGILVDRYIRVRIAAIGEAVRSVAMIFTGLAGNYGLLLGARSFLGVAEASYSPAAFSLISDYYPVKERGRMIGIFQVGSILGFVALPIGGFIGDTWGWRAAFHFLAIQGFVLAMLAWRLPEPPRGRQDREASGVAETEETEAGVGSAFARMASGRAFAAVLKIPSVLIAILSTVLASFFTAGLGIWSVTFLVRFHDMSLTQASLATSLLGIGAIIGALTGGFLGDRLVSRGIVHGRIYVAGIAKVSGLALLFPAFLIDNTGLMLLLYAIGASTLTMPNPPLSAVQADVVHPDLRGRSISVRTILNTGGAAASPLLFGLLSDIIGLRSAFLLLLPVLGLGGLLLLVFGPRYLVPDQERMQRQLRGEDDTTGTSNLGQQPPSTGGPTVSATTATEPRSVEHEPDSPGGQHRGETADPPSIERLDDAAAPEAVAVAPGPGTERRPGRRQSGAVARWVGGALVTAGLALVVVGWVQVSGREDPFQQLGWVLAVGVIALALVVIGLNVIGSSRGRRTAARLERIDQRLERLNDEVRARAARLGLDEEASVVTLDEAATYHRPGCDLLDGKDGIRGLRAGEVGERGLRACKLCEPPEVEG